MIILLVKSKLKSFKNDSDLRYKCIDLNHDRKKRFYSNWIFLPRQTSDQLFFTRKPIRCFVLRLIYQYTKLKEGTIRLKTKNTWTIYVHFSKSRWIILKVKRYIVASYSTGHLVPFCNFLHLFVFFHYVWFKVWQKKNLNYFVIKK